MLVLSACKNNQTTEDKDESGGTGSKTETTTSRSSQSDIMGTYTGQFKPIDGQGMINKITVAINEVAADGTLQGNSIVSGNNRPFKGTYKKEGAEYIVSVSEPGDDPYDGKFEFSVFPGDQKLTGKWIPNDKKLKAKSYNLAKREFKYDSSVGQYAYASTNILNEEEVANMVKSELRLMRNEIYARHGYAFKMKDMRTHFDNQEWYMPMHTDIRNTLTEIEKKNVDLIKRYEKYAAEYYDSFGR